MLYTQRTSHEESGYTILHMTDNASFTQTDTRSKRYWKRLNRPFAILGDPGAVSQAGRKGTTKVFKPRWKSPWIPTLTEPFPNGQANVGSWLGTKNTLYYCAQSANSISWAVFVSSYTMAIDWITACLAHAPKKCTQSGIFQFDIKATFQNTGSLCSRA